MNELQFLGYLVSAIITLGGFVAIIMKFIQPINDLRVVIQKLNDNIDSLKNDNKHHDEHLAKHDEQIGDLDKRVGKVEAKMDVYHKDDNR